MWTQAHADIHTHAQAHALNYDCTSTHIYLYSYECRAVLREKGNRMFYSVVNYQLNRLNYEYFVLQV